MQPLWVRLRVCSLTEPHRSHHWAWRRFCRGGWRQSWEGVPVASESELLALVVAAQRIGDLTMQCDAAADLLRYAMHLRMYGEHAPGGDETWAKFDFDSEAFLRALDGTT